MHLNGEIGWNRSVDFRQLFIGEEAASGKRLGTAFNERCQRAVGVDFLNDLIFKICNNRTGGYGWHLL